MKMPIIWINDFDAGEQLNKIEEELDELILEDEGTPEELAEALDIIQATLTYILHVHPIAAIEKALDEHYKKITGRKHDVGGVLNFTSLEVL
jgi:vacuolar-type H+-ATPase subunit I/STV1